MERISSDTSQVDVMTFREFLGWMDERSVSHDQPFMARIYQEDVAPCLKFPNKDVSPRPFLYRVANRNVAPANIQMMVDEWSINQWMIDRLFARSIKQSIDRLIDWLAD